MVPAPPPSHCLQTMPPDTTCESRLSPYGGCMLAMGGRRAAVLVVSSWHLGTGRRPAALKRRAPMVTGGGASACLAQLASKGARPRRGVVPSRTRPIGGAPVPCRAARGVPTRSRSARRLLPLLRSRRTCDRAKGASAERSRLRTHQHTIPIDP
eukprot:scaffold3678_cov355-Prasinococcus_capsulatus_cf.AAC.1